jgi:hypothetical protein
VPATGSREGRRVDWCSLSFSLVSACCRFGSREGRCEHWYSLSRGQCLLQVVGRVGVWIGVVCRLVCLVVSACYRLGSREGRRVDWYSLSCGQCWCVLGSVGEPEDFPPDLGLTLLIIRILA